MVQYGAITTALSVYRKGSYRQLKKVIIDTTTERGRPSDTVEKVIKSDRTTTAGRATPVKKSVEGELSGCQLNVRRVPRVDIDALMMEGVKEMDVIWYSAADAAQAMRLRPNFGWKAASVAHTVKKATRKLMAKKRKVLQQLAADVRDDAVDVDEQRPSVMEPLPPVDAAATSQPCRRDVLNHLLSSAPPSGVNNSTYECHQLLWPPCVADADIIFLPCDFYLLSFFFSSPNLSGRRLNVYHTSAHGVALVRI